MAQAIDEAKAEAEARKSAMKNRATTQKEKNGEYTASQLLAKFFKKPSEDARRQGKARLLYKDIIKKAERKLYELKRAKVAKSQGIEARAESLAEMLFHRPGSLLTAQEIGQAFEEAERLYFAGPRRIPSCNFPTVNIFRTIDGTCNNLKKPLLGSSGTAFKRLVPPIYEDGINSLRGTLQAQNKLKRISPFLPPVPSARLISETVILNISQDELPFTHLLMQWGQFLDHDLDLGPELEEECEGCKFTEICQPIKVPDLDRSFGRGTKNNGTCLPFRRSVPVFEILKPLSFSPEEQVNDLTSFIDGSMVYGSRLEQSLPIRAFVGGLLLEGLRFPKNQPALPIDTKMLVQCPNRMDCFLCGEVRCNEQFSLTIMHTLWFREHNRCARQLTKINPFWSDEKLYQTCRKIVGALIQKITFQDYLPKVLGYKNFDIFIGPYRGYNPLVDPSIPNAFATAAYRYGHSLIRPFFDRLNEKYLPLPVGPLNLVDAFFAPNQFKTSLGTDPIMRGWVSVNARRMDEFMNSVLTTQLFQTPLSPGLDLASLNLQRGRDHGLAPYLIYRNFCFEKFGIASYFENDLTLVRFLKLYGGLDSAELWLSGIAESRLPEGLIGATFSCIFGITFRGVRDGDRFFWLKPGVFTPAQRRSISQDSIARVICDNSDGIEFIQPDAFLSNQTRIACSRLGRVDLTLFKERACYLRAQMRPRSFLGEMSIFSRSTKPEFDFISERMPPSKSNEFMCLPIQCPTKGIPTQVMIYTSDRLLPQTRLVPNKRLPNNNAGFELPGVYQSTFPLSSFDSGRGLFREKECSRSDEVGLMFDFTESPNQFPEPEKALAEFLEGAQESQSSNPPTAETSSTSGDGGKAYIDMTTMKLPEQMMKFLQTKNANIELESVETANADLTGGSEKATKEEDKNTSLYNELEEALKKLN